MHRCAPLCLLVVLAAFVAASCAETGIPKELAAAHVEIARLQPELTRFGGDPQLGLVSGLVQGPADTGVLAIGDALCQIASTGAAAQCDASPLALESVEAMTGDNGHVDALIVSGPMGRPSAARLSARGDLVWRFDADMDNMGDVAVADLADGRAVLVSGSDSIAVLDFATGKAKGHRPRGRAMLAGDWVGDARREYVYSADDSTFALMGHQGRAIATVNAAHGTWPQPVMTTVYADAAHPYLVTSAGRRLAVYDSLFVKVRTFDATDMTAPMHVVAAAFIGAGPASPFVAVYGGPNAWHRSVLFVFNRKGAVIYKEILEDDHHVVRPVHDPTGVTFLLGGRGVVWQYRFPIGI